MWVVLCWGLVVVGWVVVVVVVGLLVFVGVCVLGWGSVFCGWGGCGVWCGFGFGWVGWVWWLVFVWAFLFSFIISLGTRMRRVVMFGVGIVSWLGNDIETVTGN
ncbi:hypothetical protein RA276_27925, partial [Pseudomonas syringae pv. tagetis]|uniref:hypothetical protein n=1 Tax=Pseudomonas syringae group genomosp. 7 TaxID=251699 RepID=UPI00376FBBF3